MAKRDDEAIIEKAKEILDRRLRRGTYRVNGSGSAAAYLQLAIGHLDHEVYGVLYLDIRNHILGFEKLFRGSCARVAISIREVARCALRRNASAVILAHNHPSGDPTPSIEDVIHTQAVASALDLIDVRVLDHIVVSSREYVSFADQSGKYGHSLSPGVSVAHAITTATKRLAEHSQTKSQSRRTRPRSD